MTGLRRYQGSYICSLQHRQLTVGGVSLTQAGQVIKNRPSSGLITHLTVLEQDTRAVDTHEADHTHISAVLSAVSH